MLYNEDRENQEDNLMFYNAKNATVKGTAVPSAQMYKKYAKQYKVYVFSRKNRLNYINC